MKFPEINLNTFPSLLFGFAVAITFHESVYAGGEGSTSPSSVMPVSSPQDPYIEEDLISPYSPRPVDDDISVRMKSLTLHTESREPVTVDHNPKHAAPRNNLWKKLKRLSLNIKQIIKSVLEPCIGCIQGNGDLSPSKTEFLATGQVVKIAYIDPEKNPTITVSDIPESGEQDLAGDVDLYSVPAGNVSGLIKTISTLFNSADSKDDNPTNSWDLLPGPVYLMKDSKITMTLRVASEDSEPKHCEVYLFLNYDDFRDYKHFPTDEIKSRAVKKIIFNSGVNKEKDTVEFSYAMPTDSYLFMVGSYPGKVIYNRSYLLNEKFIAENSLAKYKIGELDPSNDRYKSLTYTPAQDSGPMQVLAFSKSLPNWGVGKTHLEIDFTSEQE